MRDFTLSQVRRGIKSGLEREAEIWPKFRSSRPDGGVRLTFNLEVKICGFPLL